MRLSTCTPALRFFILVLAFSLALALNATAATKAVKFGNLWDGPPATLLSSAHEVQLDLGDAGCDVDPGLLLNRERLQLDRAERSANEDVGADSAYGADYTVQAISENRRSASHGVSCSLVCWLCC